MSPTSSSHPRRPLLLLALAALAVQAPPTGAQVSTAPGEWSDEFDRPGLLGRVFGLGTWDGKLYAGGEKLAGDGDLDLGHAAEFDGVRWRELGGGVHSDVRDFAEYEGDLVVAGWFDYVGEPLQEVGGVARWNGTTWSTFGQGLDLSYTFEPHVFAVEVFQGQLYAGGEFDSADGKPISTLARWDGATWQPVGGGVAGGQYPKVLDLHVTAAGELVVAGEFDTAGGQPARNIAVWDGSAWSALGAGLGSQFSSVFGLEEHDGKLYATGNFRDSGGTPVEKVAAWDGSSWSPLSSGLPDWDISVTGYCLESFGGDLYVGGNFVESGGVANSRVARWNGSSFEAIGGVAGSDLATTAIAMTIWGGELVVGGEFYVAGTDLYPGNGVASESVVGFDGTAWNPIGQGLGFDGGAGVLLEWKGEMVAGGGFRSAGETNAYGLASFDGARWSPLAYVLGGQIEDALVFEGDLVITGDYDFIDGEPLTGTLRLDAETGEWSSMPGGGGTALEVYDGQLYGLGLGGPRVWNGTAFEPFGLALFGQGYDLHAHDDGRLYIGGNLGPAGPGGGNLYSWDGAAMQLVGGGTNGTVTSLASWQGDLVVGGAFDTAGGSPLPLLARWDGSDFAPLGPGPVLDGTWIHALHVFQGDLYISGDPVLFASPYDFLAKWDAEEGLQAMPGGGPLGYPMNAYPSAFCEDAATGRLYVGGGFDQAGDYPAHGLTRWDPTPGGTAFTALGGAIPGSSGAPVLAGDGLMSAGSTITLSVASGPASSAALGIVGLSEMSLPLLGGALVPFPDVLLTGLATSPAGALQLPLSWPASVPAGTPVWFQLWLADPGAAAGLSATNGLVGTSE